MDRNLFFETINARSAAHKEATRYDVAIAEASKPCRTVIDALRLTEKGITHRTIIRTHACSSKLILIFSGNYWFMASCDSDRDWVDLRYSDTLSFEHANELGILPDNLYADYQDARAAKDAGNKHSAGLKALHDAIVYLGEDKLMELLK